MHILDEGMELEKSENLAHHNYITPPRVMMKAITQLLVSVYLFYYIFFHASSSQSCFLFRSLKFYLSAIPLHSFDRRWIFLICNGILVILANTSGLFSSTSGKLDHNDHIILQDQYLHPPAAMDSNSYRDVFLEEEVQVLLLESVEEAGNPKSENHESDILLETSESITVEDHVEQLEPAGGEGGGDEIRIDIIEDVGNDEEDENYSAEGFDPWQEQLHSTAQEDEGEEGLMLQKLSAEDLNKKFEDFIRKMKEELRIEAQQQHLVVVK